MTATRLIDRILGMAAKFQSAAAAASATENGRSPSPRDLQRLGIDVVAFGAINRS